ncbi:vacuolar protein sorting-associated protein 52 A-like [Quercus lobata]|uniref:vacuolar protein sorting-associated protein 52 A-like n=1 Tax=Quercus lobata TaxID=97700 RepID=UPI001248BA97|nr:vacuolar protein sorting-associated protein 52 A-like [Quercus lobata]
MEMTDINFTLLKDMSLILRANSRYPQKEITLRKDMLSTNVSIYKSQQLFQRDAQTITPEALESVKAVLASSEIEHKAKTKKKVVPRKAAGQAWEDLTLADWPKSIQSSLTHSSVSEIKEESSSTNEIIEVNNHGLLYYEKLSNKARAKPRSPSRSSSNEEDLGQRLEAKLQAAEQKSDDISLDGLEQELEECKNDDVVANILSEGTQLREYTKGVENNLRKVELDSIQDYIKESDNLVSLHDQIRECDRILSQMETLLSGFQVEIGSISSDIKVLQEKSMDMGLKLKNRKSAESKLAKFVEDIIVPPRMVDIVVDGEVNDEYMRTLEILSKKLKFVEVDPMVKASKALKDVQPELEKVRQKAVSKVFDFIVQKFYALRKPKTNIQILQQSVLLKYNELVCYKFSRYVCSIDAF